MRISKKSYKEILMKLNSTFFMSHKHKSLIVVFVGLLICFHFFAMVVYPASFIASKASLPIALGLMFYIWIQELKDKRRLELLNKSLIHTQKRLERAEIDTIEALILTAEAKDFYTHGHSKRVARYSLAIAKEMGLTREEQATIERSAILHDLGKIGISDNILKKDGKLTEREWEIMKAHPQMGTDILRPLRFLTKETDIILHHHEMYDGSGYPAGLKGDDIPLGAQIIAVADTFDAMNTARSYRGPLPRDKIVSELQEASGRQLNKSIAKVFLRLLENQPKISSMENLEAANQVPAGGMKNQ